MSIDATHPLALQHPVEPRRGTLSPTPAMRARRNYISRSRAGYCPACEEVIHPDAPVCRYCGQQFMVAASRRSEHSDANRWLGLLLCIIVLLMAAAILGQG